MVLAIDIAEALHEECINLYLPLGLTIPHEITMHVETTGFYAKAFNEAGFGHLTGKELWEAIVATVNWDKATPWPGHPHPDLVIEQLNNGVIAHGLVKENHT